MSANDWVAALLRATFQGGALLLLIWLVTRLWPRMPAAARCALWWVGSLRMLIGLIELPRIPVVWRAAATQWVPDVRTPMLQFSNAMAGGAAPPISAAPARAPADLIPMAMLAIWGAGMLVGFVILTLRLLALRRTWAKAAKFDDPRIAAWQNEWAVAIGRGRVPEVRASAETRVPVAFGAFHPGLLLPADSSRLSDDALRMVLAHEMSHVRRGDPLLGWVPAVAQIVFWFLPPVRYAAREYLAAREQVSDADALRATGVSPHDYGALLLDYGVARISEVPGVASCGSRGVRDLKRRLDMLSRSLRVPASHRAGAAFITIVVVALAFTPIRFVAANENKSQSEEQEKRAATQSAQDMEREAEALKAKAEADWKHKMTKGELDQYQDEKRAFEKAFGTMPDSDHPKRTPVAYMLKIEGRKGTRGAIDQMDMEAARRLDHDDRTAVYFRLGDDMWIARDEKTLDQVRSAIEPEDRMEDKMAVREGQRAAYERERQKIEERRAELDYQKARLESRRQAVLAELDEVHPSQEALQEKKDIDQELRSFWDEEQSLFDVMQMLSARTKAGYERERVSFAERDRIHQQVMEQIADIARRAIEDGRATRFEP